MIYYKTEEEIALVRQSSLLVCSALAEVASLIKPGITGADIDRAAETLIRDNGGLPAFKGYRGFPATLCVSINEQVVHGIPSNKVVFKEGDVVSVDCGVLLQGYYGDSAYTFALGHVEDEVAELLRVTNASLYKGIEQAVAGHRVGDIGFAIQNFVEKEHGYGVVRELVGHGVGRELHEAPEVPNYGIRGKGVKLQEGLVIAIEPMVNLGKRDVKTSKDGWTVYAKDLKPSAHFEHTIAIGKTHADILSDHQPIEAAIRQNDNVQKITLSVVAA